MNKNVNLENIFANTFNQEITRRQFLKMSAFALIPLFFKINLFNKENQNNRIACKNCGAINKDTRIYLFDWLVKEPIKNCYNCGIDLKKQRYKIINGLKLKEIIKNKRIGRGYYKSPVYYNIPFPNHKYLVKTNKPNFNISDIKL